MKKDFHRSPDSDDDGCFLWLALATVFVTAWVIIQFS